MNEILEQVLQFARERDWEQFHSPKNLSMALAVESAELLEHFQWLTERQSAELGPEAFARVREELADVLLYTLLLANRLEIDLEQAARDKIVLNHKKYPAELARGSARKYTAYAQPPSDPSDTP